MRTEATPDKRIEWCRENIPGFKACNDQAVKAQKETEENRQRMAAYIGRANFRRFAEKSDG